MSMQVAYKTQWNAPDSKWKVIVSLSQSKKKIRPKHNNCSEQKYCIQIPEDNNFLTPVHRLFMHVRLGVGLQKAQIYSVFFMFKVIMFMVYCKGRVAIHSVSSQISPMPPYVVSRVTMMI